MITPPRYNDLRTSAKFDEISFGSGGIRLFRLPEIEREQVGYSISQDGASLCKEGDGAWQPSWIVIGRETACGDPLILETSDPALPVLFAIHGEGTWEPEVIAVSFDAFLASLEEFARISAGRGNPAARDANPMGERERDAFLTRISGLNDQKIQIDFWEALLEA